MATILDLNTSILKMEDQEAFELVKTIRFDRRVVKKTTMRKKTSTKPNRVIDLKPLLSTMSDEARMKLIKELSGE